MWRYGAPSTTFARPSDPPPHGVWQGLWFQQSDCADNASPYDTSNSRSQVAIGQIKGREECVHAAPDVSREMFYRNKYCVGRRVSLDEYEAQKPLEFQAKCMVVLIAESSRKALLDTLVASGRTLTDPV